MNNKNIRTSEVYINNQWQSINPIDIKEGMRFRMFEPDGEPVGWEGASWEASENAYYNEDGIICIPYKE